MSGRSTRAPSLKGPTKTIQGNALTPVSCLSPTPVRPQTVLWILPMAETHTHLRPQTGARIVAAGEGHRRRTEQMIGSAVRPQAVTRPERLCSQFASGRIDACATIKASALPAITERHFGRVARSTCACAGRASLVEVRLDAVAETRLHRSAGIQARLLQIGGDWTPPQQPGHSQGRDHA